MRALPSIMGLFASEMRGSSAGVPALMSGKQLHRNDPTALSPAHILRTAERDASQQKYRIVRAHHSTLLRSKWTVREPGVDCGSVTLRRRRKQSRTSPRSARKKAEKKRLSAKHSRNGLCST
jgi:hypothetical protein